MFYEVIEMAARDARRTLRQVVYHSQSADHPIMRNLENTNYLKFLIVQVL
jgi:23S rRNA (cytosine1962-C5)-methyltransferase